MTSTNGYLIGAQQEPVARLQTPVHVVLAADDPTTSGPEGRHSSWARIADTVEGYLLAEGGHYFIRSRPADVAALVAAACPVPAGQPA